MKKKIEEKDTQLDFGLKNPPQNIYYKYKDQYELWLSKLETRRFLKDILMWFVVILSISLLTTQIYTIQTTANIPTIIPIFNYYFTLSKRLVSLEWIYLYPAIGTIALLSGVYFANKYYHKERELSKLLLMVILITNISLSIIFFKLVYTF